MNRLVDNGSPGKVMEQTTLSIREARRAAKDSGRYLLRLAEGDAALFCEPGWVMLEPARDGVVLFVHPHREIRVARRRGIL